MGSGEIKTQKWDSERQRNNRSLLWAEVFFLLHQINDRKEKRRQKQQKEEEGKKNRDAVCKMN